MEPVEYLRIFQRRWRVVAATVVVALAAAFITTITSPPQEKASGPDGYEATTILVGSGGSSTLSNPSTAAALVTVGDVPARVAKELDFQGTPAELADSVDATADTETGLLRITVDAPKAQEATTIADTFARELLVFLQDEARNMTLSNADSLRKDIDDTQQFIEGIDDDIASTNNPDELDELQTARAGAVSQLGALQKSYQQALASVPAVGLTVVQDASARPIEPDTAGLQAPQGRIPRMTIATILGLLGGLGLALVLDRVDSRIHSRSDAEHYFGMPVVAEIPRIRRKPAFIGEPTISVTGFADSFRLLAAEVVRRSETLRDRRAGGISPELLEGSIPRRQGEDKSLTILVTSAAPAEGKTTVVANLAVAFSEYGKRVVVLSCDFHRPEIHRLFGMDNDGGLGRALSGTNSPVLNGHVKQTKIPNVRLVPSGEMPQHPGELLGSERMQLALKEARRNADVVLIDTPPVLMSGMVTLLFSEVDAVMVVARAGKTTTGLAKTMDEYLKRLHTPLLGLIFNSSPASELRSAYGYGYEGYAPKPSSNGTQATSEVNDRSKSRA